MWVARSPSVEMQNPRMVEIVKLLAKLTNLTSVQGTIPKDLRRTWGFLRALE